MLVPACSMSGQSRAVSLHVLPMFVRVYSGFLLRSKTCMPGEVHSGVGVLLPLTVALTSELELVPGRCTVAAHCLCNSDGLNAEGTLPHRGSIKSILILSSLNVEPGERAGKYGNTILRGAWKRLTQSQLDMAWMFGTHRLVACKRLGVYKPQRRTQN